MHPSAYATCQRFAHTYMPHLPADACVLDIGAQDINGSLRSIFYSHKYLGVDFVKGVGVDLVLDDPYKLSLKVRYR